MSDGELLDTLNDAPILGQSMASVMVLRLDRLGGRASGNKSFKLLTYLHEARERGVKRLVSFGGAWSNHLHALAAVAHEHGLQSVGIVRGAETDTPAIEDMRRWGMQVVKISRGEYRQRNEPEYQARLVDEYGPCLVIPEGGAGLAGARGCLEIAGLIKRHAPDASRVFLPVGTGTTMAGLVAGLDRRMEVTGISVLKGADDLPRRVRSLMGELGVTESAPWKVIHTYHCGGFARVTGELQEFMQDFERVQGIPLEPVYTGKLMFAIHQLLTRRECDPQKPLLAIHTGGLQGRRGYGW